VKRLGYASAGMGDLSVTDVMDSLVERNVNGMKVNLDGIFVYCGIRRVI
jgi:hypothetical protein